MIDIIESIYSNENLSREGDFCLTHCEIFKIRAKNVNV